MTDAPRLTSIRPLWAPLGYQHYRWGTRYYISIGDPPRTLGLRAGQLYGLGFLAEIYPDLGYWRAQFPLGAYRIDKRAALSHFIRACMAAGEYRPAVATESAAQSTSV